MYVTGGMGTSGTAGGGEGFSSLDYDLPNDSYCESCAACGMAGFAHRMARLKGDGDSVDELERTLYNGVLHGISLDGMSSFYQNPLIDQNNLRSQNWACCQPLLYRTLLGVGKYIYGTTSQDIYVNLFIGSSCTFNMAGGTVPLTMTTNNYPWDGRIAITVSPAAPTAFALRIRFPGWCRNALLRLNGKIILKPEIVNRYIVLNRTWATGDQVVLTMAMSPTRVEAHPQVQADAGRVCVQRGPIIFALEGIDNGSNTDPTLAADPKLWVDHRTGLLSGVTVVHATAQDGSSLSLVPFYALANRTNSWQRVWMLQQNKTVRTQGWDDRLYREYLP